MTSSAREAACPAAPFRPAPARAPVRTENPVHGVLLVTAAVFCFSCSDASSKYLMDVLPAVQVTWLRFAVFVLVMAPVALRMGPAAALRSSHPILQVLRGLGVVVSGLLFILALGVIPLAEATAMAFVSPLFVTALSVPLLGEAVGPRRWAAVLTGLAGVLIIVRPGTDAFDPAAVLPILAALIWAGSLVITRKTSGAENPLTTMIYSALVGFVGLSVLVPFAWVGLGWREVGLGLLTGLTATAAQCFIVLAYRQASASLLAPFFYSQLVWSVLLGFAIFGSVPDSWTLAGTGVILASGLYTVHRERLRAQGRT